MWFFALLLLPLSYALGSLPIGYWLARQLGFHPNQLSPYNLGIENVWKKLGPTVAILSATADLFKGVFAVSLGAFMGIEVAFLMGLAAYIGHLYPLSVMLQGDTPPRGRGNVLLLGVVLGLYATSSLSVWFVLLPIAVFAAVLAISEFVVLATVVALAMFTLAMLLWLPLLGKLAALALFALAIWRFKENLGRMLDGTEPRFSEKVPISEESPNTVVVAFMIHPMTIKDLWQPARLAWLRPFVESGVLSEKFVLQLCEQLRPMKMAEMRNMFTPDGREIRCYLIVAPLLPEVITGKPELAVKRAIQAARLAKELGVSTFGLGAFWSTVGNKGLDVQAAVPEVHITNGGAYTSGTIKASIPSILQHFSEQGRDLSEVTAAVVGANGVVAFGIARTIAPQVKKVIMIGRDIDRLNRSMHTLQRALPQAVLESSVDVADIHEAELVFSATSDPNPVILPEHVHPKAWIFDEGRPADVHPDVMKMHPEVRIIPGGVVRPPGNMTVRINIGFGEGLVPACLAETLIIATNQAWQHCSLGPRTSSESVQYFVEEAEKLGFQVVD